MKGRWSLYWIIFLFAALFLGPTFILEGPHTLSPEPGSMRVSVAQELLRDAPNSQSSAQPGR